MTLTEYQNIPLSDLRPSPTNPRRQIRPEDLSELAASVSTHGVLEPVLVREKPDRKTRFELIAGERRYRASVAAGRETVPARILEADDLQVIELQLVENHHRTDVHPLLEAEAIQKLRDADRLYTLEALAVKLSKSESAIRRQLRLLELKGDAREAFIADAITPAHALRLAKMPEKIQAQALEHCFHQLFANNSAWKRKDWAALRESTAHVSNLDRWIHSNAVQDVTDVELQEELPELATAVTAAQQEGKSILQLSDRHWMADQDIKKFGVLPRDRWTEVEKKSDRCEHTQRAVIVHGGPVRLVDACIANPCEKHRPAQKPATSAGSYTSPRTVSASTAKWEKEQRDRRAKEAAWNKLKDAAIDALGPHLKTLKFNANIAKLFVIGGEREIEKRFGLKLTDQTAAAVLVADRIIEDVWTRDQMVRWSKLLGFNFSKFERDWQKANAPKKVVKAKSARKAKKAA
jgi:ParB/RepB/Spo0J family partition protein